MGRGSVNVHGKSHAYYVSSVIWSHFFLLCFYLDKKERSIDLRCLVFPGGWQALRVFLWTNRQTNITAKDTKRPLFRRLRIILGSEQRTQHTANHQNSLVSELQVVLPSFWVERQSSGEGKDIHLPSVLDSHRGWVELETSPAECYSVVWAQNVFRKIPSR